MRLIYLLSPLVVLVLGACGAPPQAERSDLQAYLRQVEQWGAVEGDTARTIERILDTQFVDEAAVYREIADSRVRIGPHLENLELAIPQTRRIRRIHTHYVGTWQRLLNTYRALEQGLREADQALVAEGRAGLLAWRRGLRGVADELRTAANDAGLTPGKNTNGPPTEAGEPFE